MAQLNDLLVLGNSNLLGGLTVSGKIKGDGADLTAINASNITSGTLPAARLPASSANGSYGPTAAVTGNNGEKIVIPRFTVDAYGRITAATTYEYTSVDTKNTAGATDTSSLIYLIGATAQNANPQTYSHNTVYVGTDGHLYSNSKQVVNLSDTQRLTNKTLTSPALEGTPTAPTAAVGTNTTQIATTAFVKGEINSVLTASDALIYKGTLGTGGTITALPASHSIGDTYKVITAGTYAGQTCGVGDMVICITNGSAADNAHWTVVQNNVDVMTGASSSAAGASGLVPAPAKGAQSKFLRGDGTWQSVGDITGVTAGNGLTGGGSSGSVTLHVGAGAGITVNADDVALAEVSGMAEASYGPAQDTTTLSHGSSFTVPALTTDKYGRITAISNKTITAPAGYTAGTGLTLNNNQFYVTSANVSDIINLLGEGTSPAEADDYLVAQYAGGGTTNKTYYRRKVSNVVNSERVKAALGTGSGTGKFLREDGTWVKPATLYATSSTGTANAATTNGNTCLRLLNAANAGETITIKGTGATSVTSDANGVITISSANDNTKVTQTITTTSAKYPLLLAPSGQTATTTTFSYFDSGVTLNPSTNIISGAKLEYIYDSAPTEPDAVIKIGSNNANVNIFKVYDRDTGYKATGGFGFNLMYNGGGSGVENSLTLYCDNQSATSQVIGWQLNQAGQMGVGAAANASYRLYVSGSSYFAGATTITGVTSISNTTASTSKTTGALKVSGGAGIAGRMSANEVMVGDEVILKYDTNLKALNFVF